MALTATLVNVTPNALVYLIANAATLGTELQIPSAGGVTPDLATDCVNSTFGRAACTRLRQVCRAGLDGLGAQAAGGWIAAEAQDLLIADGATQSGSPLMPRAELKIVPLSGAAGGALVEADAGVDGSGRPQINIIAAAVAGTALLFVHLRSTPGRL